MKKWILKCASLSTPNDVFNAIKDGTKKVETRPRNPESSINIETAVQGDILVFTSVETGEAIERTVSYVKVYESLQTLSLSENPNDIFPGTTNPQELLLKFNEAKKKWGSSYAKKLENYGTVAIGME